MKRYLIAFSLLITVSLGFSQTSAELGTYQLMTTNVKSGEVFSADLLLTIEANRQVSKTIVLKIGNYTWVRILSKNTINDPNFVPLPDETIEISPDDISILPIKDTSTN